MTFEQELVSHMRALRSRAFNLCKDPDRADDLVQDVMIRALKAQGQFQPGSNMRAWLFTIARNEYLTSLRTKGRFVEDVDELMTRSIPSSDDTLPALEAKDAISFLALLPEAHARVLLAAASGMSIEAMAQRENIPEGTVKSRVSRARTRLAELLGEPITSTSEVVPA